MQTRQPAALRHALGASLALSLLTLPPEMSAADGLSTWIAGGKADVLFNPRYEYGKMEGRETSHAVTMKSLLGYTTGNWQGFVGKLEFTDTRALDGDAYNAAGLNGEQEKTVIADPETTEFNQLFLRYHADGGSATLGRQRYILDNARFVGNVGWRQNEQTFDALTLAIMPASKLTLKAAFLHHINRIFADARDWEAESGLLNGSYALSPAVTITSYYYHLDFDGAVVTTDTIGGFIEGSLFASEKFALTYRLEAAFQEHAGSAVEAGYFHGVLGTEHTGLELMAGYEVLGSDNGAGQFLTPLATGHAFNGFADTYLDNGGPGGLRDLYFSVGGKVERLKLTATYHFFKSDEGSDANGRELDLVAACPLSRSLTALAKAAFYRGDARADRERFILQLTASF